MFKKNRPDVEKLIKKYKCVKTKRLRKKYFCKLLDKTKEVGIIFMDDIVIMKPDLYNILLESKKNFEEKKVELESSPIKQNLNENKQ